MNSASRIIHRNFQTSFKSLERGEIFNSTPSLRKTKKGDPTSINISALPIIKREVKSRLTRKELCSLQEFELETYTIELALLNYSYYKCMSYLAWSCEDLIAAIVTNVRKDVKFWIPDSEVYNHIKDHGAYTVEEERPPSDDFSNVEDDKNIPYAELRAHIDTYSRSTMFAANRFMRVPRLPLIIFPALFQFIKSLVPCEHKAADFYLQNLIYTSLLRAKHYHKIELNYRELNNYQKNEKFRRDIRAKEGAVRSEFKSLQGFDEDVVALMNAFRDFCLEQGMNLFGIFDKYHEMRAKEEEALAFTLNYCYHSFRKFLNAPGPIVNRVFRVQKRRLDESTAFFHYDSFTPAEFDASLQPSAEEVATLNSYIGNSRKFPGLYFEKMVYGTEQQVALMGKRFLEFYDSEGERKRRGYRYFSEDRPSWTEQDYECFYEAIEKFNHEPLANKRIAKYMGNHIDPNHVRYERQLYNKRRKEEAKTEEEPAESKAEADGS